MTQAEMDDAKIPVWVDRLAETIAKRYVIVAGPHRTLLFGRLATAGDRYEWYRADDMTGSVCDDELLNIVGPFKNAILTRLRKRAVHTVGETQFYPHSTAGGKLKQIERRWVHTASDGDVLDICATRDATRHKVQEINRLGLDRRLGLSVSSGEWHRVVGVLVDGDPAYPGLVDPLEIVVPAPLGVRRDVIYVVEQITPGDDLQHDVYGFTITRDIDGARRPVLTPYQGPLQPSFYPYPHVHRGRHRFSILYMPD